MSQPASNQPYITRITLLQLGLLTLPWLVWLTRVASNHPNAEHLALCLMNCTRRMNSALDPSAPPPAPDYSDLVSFPLCGCQLRPLLELPVADYRLPGACHIEAIFSHTTRSGFLSWSPYYLIRFTTVPVMPLFTAPPGLSGISNSRLLKTVHGYFGPDISPTGTFCSLTVCVPVTPTRHHTSCRLQPLLSLGLSHGMRACG